MKKRMIAGLLMLLMLVSALPATVFAADTQETAEITASGTCGDNAFWELYSDGLLRIYGTGAMKDYIFSSEQIWCTSPFYTRGEQIVRVVIEEGITSIGDHVFDYNAASTGLISVTIPDSVTSIGDAAFFNCDDMTSAAIPAGVTSIGDSAFYSCTSLENVTIPDGVTSIGKYAFYQCASLTSVTIPAGVTSIGSAAFGFCSSLTGIYVDEQNPYYCSDLSGVLFDKEKSILMNAPGKMSGDYAIAESVISIGVAAFSDCASLTNVTIPDSVTSIGNSAFSGCSSLTSMEIPDGVTSIENKVFLNCSSLMNVEIPADVISIGDWAFSRCTSLTNVTIPNSVTSLGQNAFASCTGLTSMTIPDGVASIGRQMLSDCTGLVSVTIPASVTQIYTFAFLNCTSLSDVYYSGTEEQWAAIDMWSGNECLTEATIHYNSTGPITEPVSGWSGYTQWNLTPDGVLTFSGEGNMKNYGYGGGQPWLDYADQIKSVVVEAGVTAIGTGAFMGMTALETITLPETGLTRIGEAAFYGCTALKEIDIPDTVYTVFDYTFKNCSSLEHVGLSKALIKVGQGAFENCIALPYVYIPGDTEIIGAWSFKGCTALAEADMQWTDATEIREGAFKNCCALTRIQLPANIQTLGDSCFYGIGATAFTVPATVTAVEAWCFARAYSLSEIAFEGDAPTIGEGAFNKIALTVYYPGDNATWTSDVMQNYGGTVTWHAN